MPVISAKSARRGNAILHRLVLQPGDTGVIRFDSTDGSPSAVFVANHGTTGNVSLSTSVVESVPELGEAFEPIRIALGVSADGTVGPSSAAAASLPSGVRMLHCSHAADADGHAVVEVQE